MSMVAVCAPAGELPAADGAIFRGEDEILEHLDGFEERADAEQHRQRSHAKVDEFTA